MTGFTRFIDKYFQFQTWHNLTETVPSSYTGSLKTVVFLLLAELLTYFETNVWASQSFVVNLNILLLIK